MHKVVQTTFRSMVEFLPSEFEVMPMSRWNESVLRYYFCRCLATADPEVEQLFECDRIDLVLSQSPLRAFIEFKLYRHPIRYDPYEGTATGFKGGPGPQNLREFQACIEKLHGRPSRPNLLKFVVLLYTDPTDESRPSLRFSHQYDEYQHLRSNIALQLVEFPAPIDTPEGIVKAQLYKVGYGTEKSGQKNGSGDF